MSQNGLAELRSTHPSSLLTALATGVGETDYHEQAATALERKQNFQSACTLKALTPLMQIVSFEQMRGMSDKDAAKLCRELVLACRKHSSEACLSLELSDDSASWGRSYFAGAVASQIANAWPRDGHKALEVNWAVSLCEIVKPLLLDGLPPSWRNTDLGVSITATTMNAIQTLMHEYDTFTMFHQDRDAVQAEFTDLLLEETMKQVEFIADTHPMTEDSQCSLAQSLIKNGGNILASLWNSSARNAIVIYQEKATPAHKEYFQQHGFPLDDIKVAFSSQMDNLAQLSIKSMDVITDLVTCSKQDSNFSLG